MSRVQLASADVKFWRSGHGSQAMPNNSKWYRIRLQQVPDNIFGSKIMVDGSIGFPERIRKNIS
jgi:hypothetical protein